MALDLNSTGSSPSASVPRRQVRFVCFRAFCSPCGGYLLFLEGSCRGMSNNAARFQRRELLSFSESFAQLTRIWRCLFFCSALLDLLLLFPALTLPTTLIIPPSPTSHNRPAAPPSRPSPSPRASPQAPSSGSPPKQEARPVPPLRPRPLPAAAALLLPAPAPATALT